MEDCQRILPNPACLFKTALIKINSTGEGKHHCHLIQKPIQAENLSACPWIWASFYMFDI